MSIVVGFRCTDGVVLCADTEITQGLQKWEESKILPIEGLPVVGFYAFVGNDIAFTKQVTDEISTELVQDHGRRPVFDTLKKNAIPIYRRFTMANKDQKLETLYAVEENGQISLYHVSGNTVAQVQGYVSLGCGNGCADTLLDLIYQDGGTVHNATIAAAYVLGHVKKNVQFCDGTPTIYTIFDEPRNVLNEPEPRRFSVLQPARATEMYASFRKIEGHLGEVLQTKFAGGLFDPEANPSTRARAKELAIHVEELVQSYNVGFSDPLSST